jgi:hypothetical protein
MRRILDRSSLQFQSTQTSLQLQLARISLYHSHLHADGCASLCRSVLLHDDVPGMLAGLGYVVRELHTQQIHAGYHSLFDAQGRLRFQK